MTLYSPSLIIEWDHPPQSHPMIYAPPDNSHTKCKHLFPTAMQQDICMALLLGELSEVPPTVITLDGA